MRNVVLCGDALEMLKTLEPESVQCCVTSPPYWGLRDYGVQDQLGLEKTPQEYVAKMVEVFREVKRVLRKDGTLWLNLGDSYAAGGNGGGTQKQDSNRGSLSMKGKAKKAPTGLKPKDLVGIPWRVAFALQADGWYLRSDIIWAKPNPMPESVTDRPTKSHEYIFLMTKSAKYCYDAEAIAEPLAYGSVDRLSQPTLESQNGNMKAVYRKPYTNESTKDYSAGGAQNASATKSRIVDSILSGELVTRNKRSVWQVNTNSYKGAHFATFPEEIPTICIKAGTKKGDTVLDQFAGSGTTLEVAKRLGRDYIGIELNEKYVKELIEPRLENTGPLFDEPKAEETVIDNNQLKLL